MLGEFFQETTKYEQGHNLEINTNTEKQLTQFK